jgi:hypothetical protein
MLLGAAVFCARYWIWKEFVALVKFTVLVFVVVFSVTFVVVSLMNNKIDSC